MKNHKDYAWNFSWNLAARARGLLDGQRDVKTPSV